MDNPSLASLSLTHVHYNPRDPVSHICAFLALVPQALVITYVSLIWATREIEIVLMFGGQMGCEALNWVLKRYIKEERPSQMHGKGYGMPSSHAQYVFFFSTFLSLFLLLRHDPHNHPHASSTHVPLPFIHRILLSLLSLASATAVSASRIYLNYHTPRQVYAGAILGTWCGVAWFVATAVARRMGVVEAVVECGLGRWARLRDLVVNEDLAEAGWARWQLRRERRVLGSLKKRT